VSIIRQPSLLSADAVSPTVNDLGGALIGGATMARLEGTAQLSIAVDHPWRASVLVTECARRGLAATCVSTVHHYIAVRTAYSAALVPLVRAWADAGPVRPPRGLTIDGGILRLWVEVAGRRDGAGYSLPLAVADEVGWEVIGAALAGLGLAGQLVSPRARGGPSYRIVGKRRLDRLVEMVGDPPKQAPTDFWPG
jgi:hypothetical protein